nr:hypothetical protein [Tanacetum cinerariifolium]
MTEAQQLKLVTKRSMQQMHISQASGSGVDEGTGSIPGVSDVPTDESEKELSWNSTDDEGADDEGKDGDDDEDDEGDDEEGDGDNDDEDDDGEEGDDDDQEVVRDDEEDDEKDDEKEGNGDEDLGLNVCGEEGHVKEEEEDELYKDSSSVSSQFVTSMLNPILDVETTDEESFDPIPKTPENSDDEGNGEENLGTNVGREKGHNEEEEEDELYRDININQGRVLTETS